MMKQSSNFVFSDGPQGAHGHDAQSPFSTSNDFSACSNKHSARDDALLLATFADIATKETSGSYYPDSSSKNSASDADVNTTPNKYSTSSSQLYIDNMNRNDVGIDTRPRCVSSSSIDDAIYPNNAIRVPSLQPPAKKVRLEIMPQQSCESPRVRFKSILKRKFSWKNYPPLETFLIANREEYLRHSTLNYTVQQKKYNNHLTVQMIELATQHGYMFDDNDFSFVTIRDRIRCYYKSYVQSLKKRGVLAGYAARKAGLVSDNDIELSAATAGKIYLPQV